MSYNEPPPAHKNHAPTIPGSSPLSLDGDCGGMDRCQYAVSFKGISIMSTPEIVLSSKRTNNYKKAKVKGGLSWMTNYYMNSLAFFYGNQFSSKYICPEKCVVPQKASAMYCVGIAERALRLPRS